VATIGVFDGVHRGHQVIINRAVSRAADAGVPSVLVTFDPHPSEVVRPGSHPAILTGPNRKAELVAALGVDAMCVLPFTPEFSRLAPETFVHTVLVESLHSVGVVVGHNFRFGHRAAGDVTLLARLGEEFGFAAEQVPLLLDGESRFSSTAIRACIAGGDIAGATRGLGREHRVEGIVVRGDGRGREIGYPTANVAAIPHAAVPADGVYAGYLVLATGRVPAAVSIGTNPTFNGRERRLEAFALDFDADIYGDYVGVDFVSRLRPTERFSEVAELVEAIDADVIATRRALAEHAEPGPA
jgi:riboflavin kinase/FMN adenylyltransferase